MMAAHVQQEVEILAEDENGSIPLRMKSKSSGVWQYFIQVEKTKAICTMCQQGYVCTGGSTSNLRKHLQRIHSINPTTGERDETAKHSLTPVVSVMQDDPVPEEPVQKKQRVDFTPSRRSFTASKAMDEKILQMVCKNRQPLSILDDDGFSSLVKLACPAYQIPSRDKLFDTLLPEAESSIQVRGRQVLDEVIAVCLAADTFTTDDLDTYLYLESHFLDSNWRRSTFVLGVYKLLDQSSESVAQVIEAIIRNWGLEPKIQCLASSDSPMLKASASLLSYSWLPYLTKSIQMVIENAVQLPEFRNVVNRISKIAAYLENNPKATTRLKEVQENYKKLSSEANNSNWLSTLEMLERYLDQRAAIKATFESLRVHIDHPSVQDQSMLQQITELLILFKEATLKLTGQSVLKSTCETILIAGNLVQKVKQFLLTRQELSACTRNFGQALLRSMFSRNFHKLHEERHLALATLLNPVTKKYGFPDDVSAEAAKKWLLETSQKLPVISIDVVDGNEMAVEVSRQNENLWKDVEFQVIFNQPDKNTSVEAKEEVLQYLSQVPLSRDDDPLLWWQKNHHTFKRLSILARQVLCVTTCESNPMINADLQQWVSTLEPDYASSIAFVGCNWDYLEDKTDQ